MVESRSFIRSKTQVNTTRNTIERLFSRIEAYRKICPGYEGKEDSYLGLGHDAYAFYHLKGSFVMTPLLRIVMKGAPESIVIPALRDD